MQRCGSTGSTRSLGVSFLVHAIENVKTNKADKPGEDSIKIVNIDIE